MRTRKCLQFAPLIIFLLIVSACGGGEGGRDGQSVQPPPTVSPPPSPPNTSVETEIQQSETISGAATVSGVDSSGVSIQILVPSYVADDVTMSESNDQGLSDDFRTVTSGFIEIDVGDAVDVPLSIRVNSADPFEVIVSFDEPNGVFAYKPFHTTEDGATEFFLQPTDGVINFALMDVPEF